jgi:lysophospholipase L1-like esterase
MFERRPKRSRATFVTGCLSILFGVAVGCAEKTSESPNGSSAGTMSGGAAGGGSSGVAGAGAGAQGGVASVAGNGGSAGTVTAGSAGVGGGGTAGTPATGGSAGTAVTAGNGGSANAAGTSGASGAAGDAPAGGTDAGGQGSAGEENGGEAGSTGDDYRACPTDGSPCKILPFGDSITDGFGTGGAYRVELFRLAHQAGKNVTFVGTGSNGPSMVDGVAFPPNHEGHSGFTIDPTPSRSGISPLVSSVMPQFTPHIVTLMIGTNDCIDDHELANAPVRLGALIDSIYQALPNVLVVVAQPIPSREDPLNARIQTYNAAVPAIVQARADAGRHIRLVDMYTPFVAVTDYKTSLLKDTWHPNEAGHAILGERWYSVLADVL